MRQTGNPELLCPAVPPRYLKPGSAEQGPNKRTLVVSRWTRKPEGDASSLCGFPALSTWPRFRSHRHEHNQGQAGLLSSRRCDLVHAVMLATA